MMADSSLETLLAGRLALAGPKVPAEPGQRSSAAIGRYVAGVISLPQLTLELESLGYSGVQLARLVQSAILDQQREEVELKASTAVQEVRRGVLDPDLLVARLVEAGLTAEWAGARAALELVRLATVVERRTSVGLVVLPEAEGQIVEVPLRPTSVGLSILAEPSGAIPEVRPRQVSLGLTVQLAPAAEVPAVVARPTTIGLQVLAPTAAGIRSPFPRETAVGLQILIHP